MCCAPSRTAGCCPPLRLRSCTVFRFSVRSRKDAFVLYHASCVPHPVSYRVRFSPYARRFFRPPCHYSLRCPTHGACFTGYPACRFSLHSVIPLVLHRGGSENPSAPGKTDCRAAGVYFGGIDFELRCFNNEIRGKSADRARAAAVFPIRRLIPSHRLSRSCSRFRRTTASLCRRIPSPVLPLPVPARILYICGRIPEGAALTAHAENSAQTAQSMKKYIHFPLSSLLQKTKKSVTIYLQKNTDINRR